ncbi:type VII secretion protein EccB (plasmid) [Mycobacterium sp. smrl_JER01]|jgi:type VII secretion protein EccB|uniref:type VII secretion protein EccB n=1 Tax=Mycobacteriaceae TaxID=1762 RepID=UPI000B94257F|nr:type VII secretion protein EccB [Mycobacterium neumannii]VEG41221.1 type VII secretion protein EccB, Actinobacterial [Mycolicibacterium flavescens]
MNLASKTQVRGHYFLRRRLGFAFQRRSVRMQTDRMRTQRLMLMISALLAVLVMVGALVVGWLRPAGLVNDSKIVADRKLGTVFVSVDGRLHPALNLVSAWLIAGQPSEPTFVSPDDLAKWPRGPLVGIEGAPTEPPKVLTPEVSRWAVCDTASETMSGRPVITGINGDLTLGDRAREVAPDTAVVGIFNEQAYVITNGVRMPVDLSDRAVVEPLGLEEAGAPVVLSQAMVDALPAGRPLVVPGVPGAGQPSTVNLGTTTPMVNGAVVVSQDVASGQDQFYVVLGSGVQPVSSVVAAMLRQRDSFGVSQPPRISPDVLGDVPVRDVLDVTGYPAEPLKVVDWRAEPVLCVAWDRGVTDRQARQRLLVGRALPVTAEQEAHLVPLVVSTADQGTLADQVLLADSPATWVSTTGASAESARRETLWLISESGARYGVPFDDEALQSLGLKNVAPRLAPWPLLRVWPAGPELSKQAAMTMHDTLAGSAAPITEQGR